MIYYEMCATELTCLCLNSAYLLSDFKGTQLFLSCLCVFGVHVNNLWCFIKNSHSGVPLRSMMGSKYLYGKTGSFGDSDACGLRTKSEKYECFRTLT